jgi:4-hydroxybenzoate polyprenyltransferase
MLMVSSCLLYVAGIVLNDYRDIEVDRKERPYRPLPSGKISKRNALVIAVVALVAANIIAITVGLASIAVSLTLTLAIIAYDFWLKRAATGPLVMGSTRFLNVIFGASPALPLILISGNLESLETAIFAASSLFIYVVAITMLSKKEVGNQEHSFIPFYVIFALTAFVVVLGLVLQLQWAFLVNLSIFTSIMIITFRQTMTRAGPSVQHAVRNMVLSIIIFDSIFVSGTAGLALGLATLLFIVPALVLARKLYVT